MLSPTLLPSSVFCRSAIHRRAQLQWPALLVSPALYQLITASTRAPVSHAVIARLSHLPQRQLVRPLTTQSEHFLFLCLEKASLNFDSFLFSFFQTHHLDRTHAWLLVCTGLNHLPNLQPESSSLHFSTTLSIDWTHLHWSYSHCVCILGPELRRKTTPWITWTKFCGNCWLGIYDWRVFTLMLENHRSFSCSVAM